MGGLELPSDVPATAMSAPFMQEPGYTKKWLKTRREFGLGSDVDEWDQVLLDGLL